MFEFLLLIAGLLFVNAAGFSYEISIHRTLKKTKNDYLKALAHRSMMIVMIVHAYTALYFSLRLYQFYSDLHDPVYMLFDSGIIISMLILAFVSGSIVKITKKLKERLG